MLTCVSPRLGLSFILTPSRLRSCSGPGPAVLLQQLWKRSAGIPGALPFTLQSPLSSPAVSLPLGTGTDFCLCCVQAALCAHRAVLPEKGSFSIWEAALFSWLYLSRDSWQGGCSDPQGGVQGSPLPAKGPSLCVPRRGCSCSLSQKIPSECQCWLPQGQRVWGSVAVTHKVQTQPRAGPCWPKAPTGSGLAGNDSEVREGQSPARFNSPVGDMRAPGKEGPELGPLP